MSTLETWAEQAKSEAGGKRSSQPPCRGVRVAGELGRCVQSIMLYCSRHMNSPQGG